MLTKIRRQKFYEKEKTTTVVLSDDPTHPGCISISYEIPRLLVATHCMVYRTTQCTQCYTCSRSCLM